MASAWIQKRTLRSGAVRYRVLYRLGGRDSAVQYSGVFRTKQAAELLQEEIRLHLAAMRIPPKADEGLDGPADFPADEAWWSVAQTSPVLRQALDLLACSSNEDGDGYVYFLDTVEVPERLKIGWTASDSVAGRIRDLQTGSPLILRCLPEGAGADELRASPAPHLRGRPAIR